MYISAHVERALHLPRQNRLLRSLRIDLLIAALPALLALVLSLLLVYPFLSDSGDDARYLILGKAMATGHGFAVISEPSNPSDRLYPYGYPILLALQMLIIGSGQELSSMVAFLKSSNSVLFAGSVFMTYRIVAGRQPRSVAFLAALLVALSPYALRLSAEVMSEIPFLFFSLVAIALLEGARRGERSPSRDVAGVIVLSFAFYVRSIGAALIVAALAYVFLRGGTRRTLGTGLLLLALLVPWFLQQTSVSADPTYWDQYSGSLSTQTEENPGSVIAPWGRILERAAWNLEGYAVRGIPNVLLPHLPSLIGQFSLPVGRGVGLVILLAVVLGWIEMARLGPRLTEFYVATSLLTVSLWWQIDRLLVPLVPFLALYLVVGARRLTLVIVGLRLEGFAKGLVQPLRRGPEEPGFSNVARGTSIGPVHHGSAAKGHILDHRATGGQTRVEARLGQKALMALFVLPFVVSPLLVDYYAISSNQARVGARSASAYFADTMPDYANYFLAAEWLEANSPPGSVVMSLKPTLTYVYSGRWTVDSPRSGDVEDVLARIESLGVDYVVEDAFTWNKSTSRFVAPAIRAHQDRFVLEYTTLPPETRLWHYIGPTK